MLFLSTYPFHSSSNIHEAFRATSNFLSQRVIIKDFNLKIAWKSSTFLKTSHLTRLSPFNFTVSRELPGTDFMRFWIFFLIMRCWRWDNKTELREKRHIIVRAHITNKFYGLRHLNHQPHHKPLAWKKRAQGIRSYMSRCFSAAMWINFPSKARSGPSVVLF